ncbi:MAG TPA: rod shape-determining protein MreD, partial [Polyangiaceae bacterium]
LVQANLHRLIGPVGSLVGPRWVHGATPSLVLPLIIYLGVYELSAPRGALLAFGIGYAQDLLSGAPIGLFTFISVSVWWLARVAGVRLSAQTALPRMSLALAFSLVEGAMVLILLAVFGEDTRRPVEVASIVLPRSLATALFSPPVFRLASLLRQTAAPVRPAES